MILLISIPAFSNSKKNNSFSLMLVKAEVNTDVISPKDEIILSATWQNVGDRAAEIPLKCFMELELGYQRSFENTPKNHRFIWDPMPSMFTSRKAAPFSPMASPLIAPVTVALPLKFKIPSLL